MSKRGNYVRLIAILVACSILTLSCEDTTDQKSGVNNITDTWQCKETSTTYGQSTYSVNITKSSTDSTKVFIDNFYQMGAGNKVTAKLSGLTLSIPNQTVDGFAITGSGTISSNYKTINWTYTVNDGAEVDHATAVYSKIP
jgi:hypothetical protein